MKKILVEYSPTDETWYDANKYEPAKYWLVHVWPKNYDDVNGMFSIALMDSNDNYHASVVHSRHDEYEKEIDIAYWKYMTIPPEILKREVDCFKYVCKGVKE
jgi:hypothetical protein